MRVRCGPGHVRLGEGQGNLAGGSSGPDGGQRPTGDDEVSGPVVEANDRVGARGDVDQLGVADELQVAAGVGGHDTPRSSMSFKSSGTDRPATSRVAAIVIGIVGGELGVDGVHEVAGDAGDHLGQLDRLGDVMDEVDEHGEVDEQQGLGDGDRQVRHEIAVGIAGDRDEGQHRVDERAHEDAQRHLIADVADEVPHHAGTELL